jgi:hypothetical protein
VLRGTVSRAVATRLTGIADRYSVAGEVIEMDAPNPRQHQQSPAEDCPDPVEESRARWRKLQAFVASLPNDIGSVDDFIREKREEAAREK